MHKLKGFPYTNLPWGWTSPAQKAYSVRPAAIQRCAGLNGGSRTSHRPKSSLSVRWCCKERLLLQLRMLTANLLSAKEVPIKIACSVTCVLPAGAEVRDNSCGFALGYEHSEAGVALGFPPPFRSPGSTPCKFPKANNDPHCFLLQAFKLWPMYTKAIWISY